MANRTASMEKSSASESVAIKSVEDAVDVVLPITAVAGKIRVKRRGKDGFGEPIAPTKTQLDANYYLEWQIGYDTPNQNSPFVTAGVFFQRKGETKYGYELSTILAAAKKLNLITVESLRELKTALATQVFTMEENDRITIENAPLNPSDLPPGFQRLIENVPVYVKKTDHGTIEIHLKHKQRAMGYQAMLYACLPMDKVLCSDGTPRPPTHAKTKEHVIYRFHRDNVSFLKDIVLAFGLASLQHGEDLQKILDCIINQ